MFLGACAGILLTKSDVLRGTLFMFFSGAGALALLPVLMSTYDYRYAFPAQVPMAWAGVLGMWAAGERWKRHPQRQQEAEHKVLRSAGSVTNFV
jgi:hypothetical protein